MREDLTFMNGDFGEGFLMKTGFGGRQGEI